MKKLIPASIGVILIALGVLSLTLPEEQFLFLLRVYLFLVSFLLGGFMIYLSYAFLKVPPPPDPRELEREYREELERILRELGERP